MTGRTKVLVGIGLVAVLGTAAGLSLTRGNSRGVEVRLEAVARRDLVATVTASGNIRARRSVDISSDVSARVAQLDVEEGDDVIEGQVLLRLDRTQLEAARSRAEAGLSQSQAMLAQQVASLSRAYREHDRIRALWNRDSLLVSRQQVEDAQTDRDVAEANAESARFQVAQAQASLDEAEDRLSKTVIRAPMDGKVTRLNVEEGETVIVGTMNNPGSLVLTISDLAVVEVVVQVDETDVPRLALGDSASVEIDAFPDLTFSGRVTEIGNSAIRPPSQQTSGQQQAIDFEVVLTLDPTEALLRPDLSATADIVTETRADVLSVPIIALTVREDTLAADTAVMRENVDDDLLSEVEGVFVVSEGTLTFAPVLIGIPGQEYFEILTGLNEGDTVVAGPYQTIRRLRNGDPVRAERGSDAGDSGAG
jgi:HlyD family secretion protein